MVDPSVYIIVRKYLNSVTEHGIPVAYGILFGSQVHGRVEKWSDIDLIVVSPHFDGKWPRKDLNLLWRIAARIDSRIEPIPVGQKQYLDDDHSAIIEIARREGEIISLAD